MLTLSNPHMELFVKSDNEIFKVKLLAKTEAEANEFCAKSKIHCSVIANDKDGNIYVVETEGTPIVTV